MMGLGPKGTSLLARLERPMEPLGDTLWIQIDQQERGEARMRARIRYGEKHKTPKKPLAPVSPKPKEKGHKRRWLWEGEDVESKGLKHFHSYSATVIRAAGFKLPVLVKKQKKSRRCTEKHEGGAGCDISFECYNAPSRCIRGEERKNEDHRKSGRAYSTNTSRNHDRIE